MFSESNPVSILPRYSAKRNLHHVDFFCCAPKAKQVMLVGDFNGWDPAATPMRRMPDGRWMASLELPHGYQQYVFLVDGKPVLDPNATGKARNKRNESVSLIAVS
jgi:1,4-alpha-glucan branching enzyme